MPIRRNIVMSASCCVHFFCSQTCPAEAGTAPDPWRYVVVYLSFKVEPPWIRFYFLVELSCSWEPSWTILALCQATFTCCLVCQFYLAHATPWQQQASAPPEAQKSTWHPTSAPHHTAGTPEDKQFYSFGTRSYKNSHYCFSLHTSVTKLFQDCSFTSVLTMHSIIHHEDR